MSKRTRQQSGDPDDSLPDISELGTAYLTPTGSMVGTRTRRIAEHQGDIQRLIEMASAVESALETLAERMKKTLDQSLHAALDHNFADLLRYRGELDAIIALHEHAIERLRAQE